MDFDASSHLRARRLPSACPPALMWVLAGSHIRARRLPIACQHLFALPTTKQMDARRWAILQPDFLMCRKVGLLFGRSDRDHKNGFRGAFFEKQSQKFWRFFRKSYLCGVKRIELIILYILLLMSSSGVCVN